MPRFLHTSDFHINALRKFDNYLERVEMTLTSIVKVARSECVDFIVVAGDVNDRLDVSPAERRLLSSWLSSVDVPVIMISGNHDKRTSEIGDSSINYLSALSTGTLLFKHVIYDGVPTVADYLDCRFVLLPYQGWMDQELFLILDALRLQYSNRKLPVIAVMHEAVYGCKNDVGFSVTKRNQIHLDTAISEGVTYWALGDMHKCQSMLPNAWYSGAPHQTRFDEGSDKGVLIVDTANPTSPSFVRINSIPLVTIDKEPDGGWPSANEAFIHYNPPANSVPPVGVLPNNVKYNPIASTLGALSAAKGPAASLFDGLDEILSRSNLPPFLYPLAWNLAVKISRSIGVDTEIPDRYRE